MMVNARGLLIAVLALIPLAAECMQPKGRYQWLAVVDQGGVLCLKVNDTKESRRYRSEVSVVDVYEDVAGTQTRIWMQHYVSTVSAIPTVSPDDCLAHDVLETNPLPEFGVGKRYTASVVGVIEKEAGRRERRYYQGYFCMVEIDGVPRVQQVLFDKRRGEWAWNACAPARADRTSAPVR